jgi:hypothetical protein
MIEVEVDQQDLKKVLNKLKDMEKAPRHLRNAINRTATVAMRMIKQGRSQGYTIKTSRFNQDLGKIQKATPEHLDATIKAKGKPPTLTKSFKTSMPKAGGKADITKSGLKRLVTATGGAAFIPSGGKAEGLMAQRRGSSRFPLRVLYGNSVPKMVEQIYQGKRGGQGDMEDVIRKRLHEEMMAEIAKIM